MLMQREDENEAIKNEAIKNEDVKNEATKTVDVNQPPLTEYEGASMQRPSPPPPVGVLHFYQVAGILRRRSRLILMIAGIGTVLAAGVGLLIPPKYTATALLVLELQVGTGGERALAASVIDESIDTHVTLLSSRDHLQRVIESFSGAPEVPGAVRKNTDAGAPPAVKNGALQSAALNDPADSIVTETGFLNGLEQRLEIWIGALRRDESAAMPILDEVERHTRVNQQRRSRVISVSFTSTSSQKAAAFANRIVQLYVTHLIKQKQASASGEMARLGERIAESKYEMERAELAVETAARKNLSPEPNVKGEEREDEGQLRELARHAGMTAQLYGNLLLRKKQMRDDQETILPGVEITSLASVPHRPSSHNPILFIFPAFLVFAVGGSWLAVVLEQLDRGLRSRRGTSEALGIPCIGLVPQLPREAAFRPDRHLLREPFSAYTEAIRSAVVALQLQIPRVYVRWC